MAMVKNNQLVIQLDLDDFAPKDLEGKALLASLESFRGLQRELSAHRENVGFTQADLAAKMGCSQPMVSKIEGSQAGIRIGTLMSYASAMGLSIRFELEPENPN